MDWYLEILCYLYSARQSKVKNLQFFEHFQLLFISEDVYRAAHVLELMQQHSPRMGLIQCSAVSGPTLNRGSIQGEDGVLSDRHDSLL